MSYDKNYSYTEMMDAFHAGRLSVINEIHAESGTWALQWIDEYTKARDMDEDTRRIDTMVEAEQDDTELSNDESND